MRTALLLLFVVACGEPEVEDSEPPADTEDTSPPDPLAFGTPASAGLGLAGFAADDPTLDRAAISVFFDSNRTGGQGNSDIWWADRGFPTQPWDPPANETAVNSAANEATPELSADGRTLYFVSDRDGNFDVFTATRSSGSARFGAPTKVTAVNGTGDEFNPTPSADGLQLYLVRRPGTHQDLYLAERASTSDFWGAPAPIAELNTGSNEADPYLTADGLMLFFSSDRPGGAGDWDIWVSRRATVEDSWGDPEPVTAINGPSRDVDPWLSEDGSRFWFASDRDGAPDLYEAIHPELSE